MLAMKDDITESKSNIATHHERLKKMEDNHIPSNVKQSHLKTLTNWKIDDKLYYDETRSYQASKKMIQTESCSVVGLVGGPGCGKTATVKHIALTYEQDGYEVIPVVEFDKIEMYGNSKLKQLFILDNILGVHSVNMNLYYNLNSNREGILNSIGNESKLLFTCRKTVYNEAIKLKSFVLDNVVDFESEENKLNDKEKRNLLAKHCRFKKVPEDKYCDFSSSASFFMFPLLCKMYSTTYQEHVSVNTFFANPVECIIKELDDMERKSPLQYAALVLIVLSNNMLSFDNITVDKKDMKQATFTTCRVNIGTSDKDITDTILNMVGTYLVEKENCITCVHDVVYQIVAFHYGKTNPCMILKYLNSNYIATNVTVDKDQSTDLSINLSILIEEKHYKQLAERIYTDIQSFELFDVFMNKSLKYLPFLKIFIETLEEKPYEELKPLIFHEQVSSKIIDICTDNNRKTHKKEHGFRLENTQRLLKNRTLYASETILQYPRIISWIINYGHTYLLTSLVKLVKEHNDSTDIVFGSDIIEQTRLLTLGCYSGEDKMVNLILKYVKIGCINKTSLDKTLACSKSALFIISNQHRTYSPLTAACHSGHLSVVQILLKNNAQINKCDDLDRFPLLCASVQGHNHVVEYLLQKGGKVNQCDGYKETALHCASYNGHYNVVKYLVQQGAQVNQCDTREKSPLYKASEGGHIAVVEFLIEKGADINQCDAYNISPLYKASEEEHIAVVKFLVKNGADVQQCDNHNQSALYQASERGLTDVVKFLVEKGAHVNHCDKNNTSPLYIACHKGNTAVIEFLVEKGASVNQCDTDKKSPLYKACNRGDTAVVEFLVESGANVNQCDKNNRSPLYKACKKGQTAIVKFLVENGANVNQCDKNNRSPLYIVCKTKNRDVVEYLVAKGANINQCDADNSSPLHEACFENKFTFEELLYRFGDKIKDQRNELYRSCEAEKEEYKAVVKYLVEKGANVNQCNTNNQSPLYQVCDGGNKAVVEFLIENGADINQCDKDNKSPLYKASAGGHTDAVQYLVKNGAVVNQYDADNKSPLYKASEGGFFEVDKETSFSKASRKKYLNVVKYLVQNGADVNQCSKDKKTPLYNAVKIRHFNMVKFLIENKSDLTVRTYDDISPLKLAVWLNSSEIATELIRMENHSIPFSANHHLLDILIDIRKTEVYVTDEAVHDGVETVEKHPLSNYVLNCTVEQLEHLFKLGLNVNQYSNEEHSLLRGLIESPEVLGRCLKVELCIQNGADLTIRDCHSMSILEKYRQFIKQRNGWRRAKVKQKKIIQSLKQHMRRNSF